MRHFFSKSRSKENPESPAFLIVGLGNPGREYRHNRHNIGFMLLDRLANNFGESFSRFESRALVIKVNYLEHRLILAKPHTYMNNSGGPVSSLLRFYKISLDKLLIVYDDVDLPLGKLRMRPGGGSAGHRGMKSIIERLGTEEFPRLRIGIGRPPGRKEAADYVLKNFSDQEQQLLPEILDECLEAVISFVTAGIDQAMNQFNATVIDN